MKTRYPYSDVTDGQKTAVFTKIGGREALDRFLRDELVVVEPPPTRRLKFRDTIDCPKIERFIAKDNFSQGMVNGVKFFGFGDTFKKLFFPKVETNIAEATLRSHELLSNSKDLGILREIEEGKEVITLAHLHYLLTLQGEGQKEGVLLTNGYNNIFYIIGNDGNLWAVFASWHDGGWRLSADPVEGPCGWDAGSRVFSR